VLRGASVTISDAFPDNSFQLRNGAKLEGAGIIVSPGGCNIAGVISSAGKSYSPAADLTHAGTDAGNDTDTLTLDGNVAMSSSSRIDIRINSPTDFDRLNITGNVDITAGSTLNVAGWTGDDVALISAASGLDADTWTTAGISGHVLWVRKVRELILSTPSNINVTTVSDIPASVVYNGHPYMPAPAVTDRGTLLEKEVHYTLAYNENIYAGEHAGAVVISGVGKYFASRTQAFDILKKQLYIDDPVLSTSKIYDGATTAEVLAGNVAGVVDEDKQEISLTAVADYDDASVRTSKTITVHYALEGSKAGNYQAPDDYLAHNGVIMAKELSLTASVKNKIYDGLDAAEFDAVSPLMGLIPNETVDLGNGIPSFSDVNAGTDIPINITDFTLSGAAAHNYALRQPADVKANISKAAVHVALRDGNAFYTGQPLFIDDAIVTGSVTGSVIPLTYVYQKDGETSDHAFDVGTYAVVATATHANYEGVSDPANFTVNTPVAEILSIAVNGEQIPLDRLYVDMGCGRDDYRIEIEAPDYARIADEAVFTGTMSKPEVRQIAISVSSGAIQQSRSYTLTIEKRFDFNALVVNRWDNTLSVRNNPLTNGGFTFQSYRWYRKAAGSDAFTALGDGQFYTAGNAGERLHPDDVYYVEVTTDDGHILRSCEGAPVLHVLPDVIRAYPNPAPAHAPLYLDAGVTHELWLGAEIRLYDVTGNMVERISVTGPVTSLQAPDIPGMYLCVFQAKNGWRKEMKIIVSP
jgi:hypothetical protein